MITISLGEGVCSYDLIGNLLQIFYVHWGDMNHYV
jgi:hypothetical protein